MTEPTLNIVETPDPKTAERTGSDPGTPGGDMRRELIEFVKLVAWFLVVFIVVKTYVVEGYEVQGPSMYPTLRDRERILVFKLPHVLERIGILSRGSAVKEGQVVVFESTVELNKRYVKRVIAKGPASTGDNTVGAAGKDDSTAQPTRVRFDQGRVYVNNHKQDEPYLTEEAQNVDETLPERKVGADEYYVLGDNRSVSKDSRVFGGVHERQIVGTAFFRFWPLNSFGPLR